MDSFWSTLTISFKIAGLATLINLILGILVGYILARKTFKGKNLLDTLLTLPMVMPPTVLGYYLLILLGNNSWLGVLLKKLGVNLIFTWQGAVIACAIATFPLVLNPTKTAFENLDKRFEQAAQILGIPEWAIFFRVTLPLAWNNILTGMLLAFARSLGEFGATLMVAGNIPGKTQTLSIAIYDAVQAGEDQLANILVIIISITCVIILLLAKYLTLKNKD